MTPFRQLVRVHVSKSMSLSCLLILALNSATVGQENKKTDALLQNEPYVNKELGLSIRFPKNFADVPGQPKGTIVLYRDPKTQANINLRSGNTKDDIASAFAQVKKALVASSVKNNGKMNFEGDTTIDSVPAKWIDLSHTFEGKDLRVIVFVIVKQQKFYMIFCTAPAGEFASQLPAFGASAESFKVK